MFLIQENLFIYFSLIIVLLSMIFYSIDKFSMVFKSIVILTFLLIFFSVFPYLDDNNNNLLNPQNILNGFGNTSFNYGNFLTHIGARSCSNKST